jgi:hypothetical protein
MFSTYFRKKKKKKAKMLSKSVQQKPSYFMRTDGQTDKRTDGHEEANNRFSQCCERA